MTEVGVIWGAIAYAPGSQIEGRIVIRDGAGRAPQSIRWQAEYNSANTVLSGSTEQIVIPRAESGLYRVIITVVDSAGQTVSGASSIAVGDFSQQTRASVQVRPENGTFVLMGRLFTFHKVFGPSTAASGPSVVFTDSEDIFLIPGTTHVTFDFDPAASSGADDVVARTRYGNWALRGGAGLNGTQRLGYAYRIDNTFVPAPADLRLRLTMDAVRLAAGTVPQGSFRVRINCWRLTSTLFQYERCPFSIHPGGQAFRQRRFAVLFTEAEIETDYLSPQNNRLLATSTRTVFSAPNVTTIPSMALAATGSPYPTNQGTGSAYTEANRYAVYETSGQTENLDIKAVAGLEGARPFALWLNQQDNPKVVQRIKRLGGELVVYVNNGPIIAGSFVTVRVESGQGLISRTFAVSETVYSGDPELFVRVGSVAFDEEDFQFGITGLVANCFVSEISVPNSPSSIQSESYPAWGPEVILAGTATPAIHFDGACYVNPTQVAFTVAEEVAVVTAIQGCHNSVCGPVGLYCYTDGLSETPSVTVSASDASAGEPYNQGAFTFTRTGSTAGTLTVDFTVAGSATPGADYNNIGTSVTFSAGQATAIKYVNVINDADIESDETVIVTLQPGTGYTVGSPDTATVTITSEDLPVVTVAATDALASETGPDTGTFTFYRTGPTTGSLSVLFAVGGTASSGTDYLPIVSPVVFSPGQASVTKTLTPINDVNVEPVETVTVTVLPGTGYSVGAPSSASADITSDDVIPTITVSATDSTATEAGPTTGTFTFYRTGTTVGSLTVYFTVGGSAASGTDYASIGTSVTFGPGDATATKTVTPVNDSDVEIDETVTVTLQADPAYAVGAPNTATVTITSDDVVPSAMLTVTLEGGQDVDAWAWDTNVVVRQEYELVAYSALNDSRPDLVYPYIDGSNGDNDPFVNGDPAYKGMMEDVLERGRDVEFPLIDPTLDGVTSPTWVYGYQGGRLGFPHTFWNAYTEYPVVFWNGWSAIVYGFKKSDYPNVIPGRYDSDPTTSTGNVAIPGTIGQDYTASVRVRGVFQRSVYTGGSNNGAYLQTGGAVQDTFQDKIKLTISDPPAVYYLNRSATASPTSYNVPVDYTVSIPVKGGATATVEIDNQDGFQYRAGSDGQPVPLSGFSPSENVWVRLDITL